MSGFDEGFSFPMRDFFSSGKRLQFANWNIATDLAGKTSRNGPLNQWQTLRLLGNELDNTQLG